MGWTRVARPNLLVRISLVVDSAYGPLPPDNGFTGLSPFSCIYSGNTADSDLPRSTTTSLATPICISRCPGVDDHLFPTKNDWPNGSRGGEHRRDHKHFHRYS